MYCTVFYDNWLIRPDLFFFWKFSFHVCMKLCIIFTFQHQWHQNLKSYPQNQLPTKSATKSCCWLCFLLLCICLATISDILEKFVNRHVKEINQNSLVLLCVFDPRCLFGLWSALCRKPDFTDWQNCNQRLQRHSVTQLSGWQRVATAAWDKCWLFPEYTGFHAPVFSFLFSALIHALLPFCRWPLMLSGNHDEVWAKSLLTLTAATIM